MKLFRVRDGALVQHEGNWHRLENDWQGLTVRDDLRTYVETLLPRPVDEPGSGGFLSPIGLQEVWAAGVTYYRSRSARMEESRVAGGGNFYDRVYSADRPELFFKSSPHRVAGPGTPVRIRSDSQWNVPEPELTVLFSPSGKLMGYTIGNDMSSRDIEGENPLYLPQAKVYDRSCALGPGILVSSDPLPLATRIQMEILRNGTITFSGDTTLECMKRTPEALRHYLFRENSFPNGCFLLTGTGIIPPDSFTLEHGDLIRISIDGIGVLENSVE